MNKRSSSDQRDDIVAWFRSMPGLIVSSIILAGFGIWLVVSFGIDLFVQATAG